MPLIEADDATGLFVEAATTVAQLGTTVTPRGLPTREIYGAHLCLHRPRARLVSGIPGRVVNPAFAAAEAIWILSGSDEPWIYEYNSRLRKYADDGVLRGAYGPRLRRWAGLSTNSPGWSRRCAPILTRAAPWSSSTTRRRT